MFVFDFRADGHGRIIVHVDQAQPAGSEVIQAGLVAAALVHVEDVGQQPGVPHTAFGRHEQGFSHCAQRTGDPPELQQGLWGKFRHGIGQFGESPGDGEQVDFPVMDALGRRGYEGACQDLRHLEAPSRLLQSPGMAIRFRYRPFEKSDQVDDSDPASLRMFA